MSNPTTTAPFDRPPEAQSASKIQQPKPQTLPRSGPSSILVSTRQKGNPILNHVKSLPWEYSDTPADYVLGATTCALFLSLKYHRLHPEYIYARIRALGKLYNLRVLLVMVDIENHEASLQELSKTSMINNFTLILSWSSQEAGRYLELFKSYEHASPASIRARQAESYSESLKEFVTTPRNINKTDAATLISNFGTLRNAVNAEPEQLAVLPGWGEKKVRAWYGIVREPFRVKRAARVEGLVGDRFVPIGRALPKSRENTIPDEPPRETGQKKRTLDELVPDDFDDLDLTADEEEALRLAEMSTAQATAETATETIAEQATDTNTSKELAPGIAAALAKYRTG